MRVPIGKTQAQDEEKAISIAIHTNKPSQDNPPHYHEDPDQLSLQLHPLPTQDALLVKIQPPRAPAPPADGTKAHHVPCDIVLVVDVSGSMSSAANVPGEDESTGLSVLDLVKHAAKTILETMDQRDRLGIVTFGARSQIVQRLLPMMDDNKSKAQENIDSMRAGGATNLWHGILDGFKLFENAPKRNNVPAIMVLTDGLPNHMCPSAGYIPKLRTMMPFPGSIHTFGFGYRLRSGLLKSIAEIGSGNYAFIPDAGMIGTVFVHAVANLQSTFATSATLRLKYPAPLELEEATGASVEQTPPEVFDGMEGRLSVLEIQLGNIQFGQSRDVLLRVKNLPPLKELEALSEKPSLLVDASLIFSRAAVPSAPPPSSSSWSFFKSRSAPEPPSRVAANRNMLDSTNLPEAETAYHESRAQLCSFLSSIFPLGAVDSERRAKRFKPGEFQEVQEALSKLINTIPARNQADTLNESLMEDLHGEEPRGQISIAINNEANFNKWGVHYLLSYLNAHTRQICNSFKDAGPLQYGVNSPLFCACRTRLDTAFDSLPAPTPSLLADMYAQGPSHRGSTGRYTSFSMSAYNRSSGPCFAASTPIELASGRTVRISRLRRGMKVRTPAGPRRVALVLRTPVENQIVCRVGSLLVTPWHPISHGDARSSKSWCFPAMVADNPVWYSGAVYSILLQQDRSPDAHAIRVADAWGVTLGHGVTASCSSRDDVRAHDFLGDWARVAKCLVQLGADGRGVVVGGGVQRDEHTGRMCGFVKAGDRTEQTRYEQETSGVLVK